MAGDDPAVAAAHRIVVDLSAERGSPDDVAFRLKTYMTELRGSSPGVRLGIHAPADLLARLRERGVGAYLDVEARAATDVPPFPGLPAPGTSVVSLHDANGGAGGQPEQWIVWLPADATAASAIARDLAASAPVLVDGLLSGGMVEVRCAGRPVPTYLNPESLETIAIDASCSGSPPVTVPDSPLAIRATLSSGVRLMTVAAPAGGFAEGVSVVGARRLSVREVIARHQAAAARQRRDVRQLISTGQMTLTFEAPGFPAPMTITTQAVLYASAGILEIEQRDIRVNGIAFPRDRVPRLPLLEPERVASPPLAIALNDAYRYALEQDDTVDGVRCYVVRFDPVDARRALFSGRAWIAADDFAMVRVAAVQSGLRGAIVSSEQTDAFRRERPGVWLLQRSEVHQIYEGAGHRTPIHRVLAVERHEINPQAFDSRRQSAYASPSIMLRDTADGFRYLVRRKGEEPGSAAVEPAVAKSSERVRTVAVGVILDPNISQPLPFAGLSYIDFDLFGTGTQLNGFFGGTYGQVAIAVPSIGGTRWQLGGRAFGIVSSYNDRAFVDGREIYAANISQRPAHASVWLLRPVTARLTMRAGYELDYTAYGRVDSTAATFEVPRCTGRACAACRGRRAVGRLVRVRVVGRRAARRLAPLGRAGQRVRQRAARLPAGRGTRVSLVRRVATSGGTNGGRRDDRARPRPVQPVFVRQLRQSPARLSVRPGALRRRRRVAQRGGLGAGPIPAARRIRRCRARARPRLRPRIPHLRRDRRGGGSPGAVWHPGGDRVGLRVSGHRLQRPARHAGRAHQRV